MERVYSYNPGTRTGLSAFGTSFGSLPNTEVVVTIRTIGLAKLLSLLTNQHPTFLQTRCSSSHLINSVKALKGDC